MGLQAVATPTVKEQVNKTFFKSMGITLVVMFSTWFVVSLCVHVFVLKNYEPKETAEWMVSVMYVPSRLSFLVWGPWLQSQASKGWKSLNANKSQIDKMSIINQCADAQSQINI